MAEETAAGALMAGHTKDYPSFGQRIGGFFSGLTSEPESVKRQREDLRLQGASSSAFADKSQGQFGALGNEAAQGRDYLRRIAGGQQSISAEQLRQGLQQNMAGQRSMAAGASPGNAPMAARSAAMNMARMGSGLAGQQAVAGMQERQNAQKALQDSIMMQRQQELQASLQGRQNAISGFGGGTPEKSMLEQWQPVINMGIGAAGAAMSDKRLKKDIEDGDEKASRILKGLKSYSYKYKDEKHGKGDQYGLMAQEMEKSGLGHAVIDTPQGKAVHGAKAALSGLALTAALARRVEKLEGGKK
jgi:hypothetical protein